MIIKNILRFLIISVISPQISWAKPQPKEAAVLESKDSCLQNAKYNVMELSEADSLLSPSNQLFKFTLKGFQELSLNYAINAQNISEQMLRDSEISNSKSVKILQFKQNLTKFEEKYSQCNDIDELFQLVEMYSNTTTFYFELKETSLDDDVKLILRLLKKYGSENLNQESMKLFNEFVNKFNNKFKDLKQALEKEESKIAKKILERSGDWYPIVHSKTVTNYEDEMAAFGKVFEIFHEES